MDEKFLLKIIELQKSTKLDFILRIGSDTFPLKNVAIIKSSTPVNRPTNRGGVYFSDTFVFKIIAQVADDAHIVKNPAAVALGRLGGLKGGKARAMMLTPARRVEIAKKAAMARWGK